MRSCSVSISYCNFKGLCSCCLLQPQALYQYTCHDTCLPGKLHSTLFRLCKLYLISFRDGKSASKAKERKRNEYNLQALDKDFSFLCGLGLFLPRLDNFHEVYQWSYVLDQAVPWISGPRQQLELTDLQDVISYSLGDVCWNVTVCVHLLFLLESYQIHCNEAKLCDTRDSITINARTFLYTRAA